MALVDIKSAFAGEIAFYQAVLQEERYRKKLMAVLDVGSLDDFVADVRTQAGKYADVVLYDSAEEAYAVLEFQLGFLDAVHASKITYYLHSQGINFGVLICEDVDEDIRDFVKDLNERGYSISILKPIVIRDSDGSIDVEWMWLLRASKVATTQEGQPNHYPRNGRLLAAQAYASTQYGELLRDYDQQTLGKNLIYGKNTYLTMVFNSAGDRVEISIYDKYAANMDYCATYENLTLEFAKANNLEYVDTSTNSRKCYRFNVQQSASDEAQSHQMVDLYIAFGRYLESAPNDGSDE